jgi:RNA polymerase sigma-70 factor (ECF subfamily)
MTTEHKLPSKPTVDIDFYAQQMGKLHPRVLRLARRLVGNAADAEEVAQEAFLKAFQHIKDYRHEASFSTWLLRIVWNESMDFHRKRSLEVIGLDDLSPGQERRYPVIWTTLRETPEQICITREIERLVARSLRRVPLRYRKVWFLRECNHLSDAEVARQLDLPVGTVRVRMHRARRQLQRLVRAGLPCPLPTLHHRGGTSSAMALAEKVVALDCAPATSGCPVQAA